ncbi:hypothetical protein [Pseudomonas sp. yb_5]|uniref:hypothetical protein n=1 Tax=Pseudomonas sp. yb_5 TaxID=3367220 RepID=UPI00370A7908
MANELDLYDPGDLAPYSPGGLQPLAPAPAPDWQHGGDLLPTDYHAPSQGQPLVFGRPLPAGVSIEQVMQGFQQLGGVFVGDMMKLGHNITHTQQAVKWFMDSITNPPAKQQPHTRYNLFEHASDPLFCAFSYFAAEKGMSTRMVQDMCWWVSEAGRKLSQNSQSQHGTPPRMAPSSDPTDSLTDAEFEAVVKINQQAAMNTEITLRRKWGDSSYVQNVQVAQRYLDSLPPKERQHFEQFTTGWVKALNTAEVIEGLFNMAIGAANIPTSGGGVQAEISQIEGLMRDPVSRRAYLKDAQLQARLRTLYTMRDGG